MIERTAGPGIAGGVADDGRRVALIVMDRARGTRSSEPAMQGGRALPWRHATRLPLHPTMAEFMSIGRCWSLKPLDGKIAFVLMTCWVMPAGGANTLVVHSPLLGLPVCSLTIPPSCDRASLVGWAPADCACSPRRRGYRQSRIARADLPRRRRRRAAQP